VSPEDTTISAGGGVALTLLTKAGPRFILNELAKLGPIQHGTCAVTSAGDLPVHYIMHAAALHIQKDGTYEISPERVFETTDSVLTNAETLGVKAIWIPLLGAGVADLPADASFRSIVSAFAKHSPSPACPLVHVVIFQERMLPREDVREIIQEVLPSLKISGS
jgi:O-acetyl-ADP-ribose deacetylase (regulator of RNase III)